MFSGKKFISAVSLLAILSSPAWFAMPTRERAKRAAC